MLKFISKEAWKNIFTITDENDELDWEEVKISVVQIIIIALLAFVVWLFV